MSLGAPSALWLLALLPLLVLLYMLRARRQPLPVSSVLLWQRARRDLAAQLPIRRLERSLLLVLQLLAVTLIVLALARPQVPMPAGRGPGLVVVLDVSASMQATDVMPSRFFAARAQAQTLVARAGDPVMVVAAAGQPRIVAPWGTAGRAIGALQALVPTDGPADLAAAVALAASQRTGAGRPQVVVFTDRAGPAADGVTYRIVGRASANLAVVGLHAEPAAGGARVLVQLRNSGARSQRAPLVVSVDGRPVLTRTVEIPAAGTAAVSGRIAGRGSGTLRAELRSGDALAVDDAARLVLGAPPPRVLVVGEPDRLLGEALAALGARYTAAERVTAEVLAASDIIVLNRTPPVELPPGRYLLLGTVARNLPLAVDGTVAAPQVLRWARGHPLMRYVDLSGLQILQTLALRPAGGEVLAEGEVPLIWSYERAGLRAVVFGFALGQSDLPLRPAFPILLSHIVRWLDGPTEPVAAGTALALPAGGAAQATLVDPDGRRRTLPAQDGQVIVPALDRAGVYTLIAGGRERKIAVNVPPAEAEIAPLPARSEAGGAPTAAPVDRALPLWPLALGGAAAVLVAEWLLWLRGLPHAAPARPAATGGTRRTVRARAMES